MKLFGKSRRRKKPTLIDVVARNMMKPDPKKGPKVDMTPRLYPIRHSSMN